MPTRTAAAPPLRRAAFFDRDGTLNVDPGYVWRPQDLHWVEGAREAIAWLKRRDWLVLVCTNQSGVARGFFSEADVAEFHDAMQRDLASHGAKIDAFYLCPFHPEGAVQQYRREHPDRKPAPGMLLRAMQDWSVDPAISFAVGDRPRDVEAGQAAGLRSFHFERGRLDHFVEKCVETLSMR